MTHRPPHTPLDNADSQRFFLLGCGLEVILGALGLLAMWPLNRPFHHWWRVDFGIVCAGTAATLPLLALFYLILRARRGPLFPIRIWLESQLRPLLQPWSVWQMGLLSLLAGGSEELFFRGALQGWITQIWGNAPAIVVASIAFGAMHAVHFSYAILATLLGLYLGALYWFTQSLVAPALAHALYDFLALLLLLRVFHAQKNGPTKPVAH